MGERGRVGTAAALEFLQDRLGAQVVAGQPLAEYTTLRVGGAAAVFVRAETVDDLGVVAHACAAFEVPWLVVGRGSNLLVADDGWQGVAIRLGKGFRGVEVTDERIVAGAAEPMPALARHAALHSLSGLAFGVAIPGTLGGAVRMNAGAHGGELAGVLEWADVVRLGAEGEQERWVAADLAMGYRTTRLPSDAVVVKAALHLRPADEDELTKEMAEMKRWRREHQPLNQPSCGSVFRNPPGDSAGRLIEAAGLKGLRRGGAEVSRVHANFITATSGATADDVRQVITTVQETVRERFDVALVTEVVLAGFDRPDQNAGLTV